MAAASRRRLGRWWLPAPPAPLEEQRAPGGRRADRLSQPIVSWLLPLIGALRLELAAGLPVHEGRSYNGTTERLSYNNTKKGACARNSIALLLSGQLRTFRAVYRALQWFVLIPLRPSVFIFTEALPGYPGGSRALLEELKKLYNPCKAVIDVLHADASRSFLGVSVPEVLRRAEPVHGDKGGNLPNVYELWAANGLKRAAERERGLRFALVIRARWDLLFLSKLPPEVLEGSPTLWYSDLDLDTTFQVSDKLVVASSEAMDYYASLWPRLRHYWRDPLGHNPPWTHRVGERLIKQHMDLGRFAVRPFHVDSLVLRPWMLLGE